MTLLFDGTFTSSDVGLPPSFFQKWNRWTCIPQPDSLVIIPAPGGRQGYAAKFKIGSSPAYDCGGNQHAQIRAYTPTPNPYREVWVGWSDMIDTSWQATCDWNFFGFASISVYKGGGLTTGFVNGYLDDGGCDTRKIYQTNSEQRSKILSAQTKGEWYDWLMHYKFATDNTGFVEIFLRRQNESNYALIYSKYNFATWWIGYPGQTQSNDIHEFIIGPYRNARSDFYDHIYYYMNPKMATTREEVEYGVPSPCPDPICNFETEAQ